MNKYSLWAQIRKDRVGRCSVRVTAIPLNSRVLPQPGDCVSDTAISFVEATGLRDRLVAALKKTVEGRGDAVMAIESLVTEE